MADLDYKRPKIDVYVMNDIFNQCANPLDSEELHEQSQTKEGSNNVTDEDQFKSALTAENKLPEVLDYAKCQVPKPTREDVYNEEDYEYMQLVPEPSEPKLYELTQKIYMEKQRRQHLLASNQPIP